MYRAIAMIFALRALLAPSSPAIVVPNLATPQSEIATVADVYVKATLASDAAGVAVLYQEDGVEMPAGRPLVKGRPGIEHLPSCTHEGGEVMLRHGRRVEDRVRHPQQRSAADHAACVRSEPMSVSCPTPHARLSYRRLRF